MKRECVTSNEKSENAIITSKRIREASAIIKIYIILNHIAYLRVHSFAFCSYLALSYLYMSPISRHKHSSGLGSVNNDEIDRRTLEIVREGDHVSFKISTAIEPLALILGWKIRV